MRSSSTRGSFPFRPMPGRATAWPYPRAETTTSVQRPVLSRSFVSPAPARDVNPQVCVRREHRATASGEPKTMGETQ